jgi:hypothetical protein
VNVRKALRSFRRARDCSDYRLDRMKGVAIADPGPVPAIYSLQCILGALRTVVPRKYDKLECGIDIPSLS